MDETSKIEILQREVNALKQGMDQMKSEVAAALSKMNNAIATKDQEINNLRASVEELKRNYEVEETITDSPEEENPESEEEDNDESVD